MASQKGEQKENNSDKTITVFANHADSSKFDIDSGDKVLNTFTGIIDRNLRFVRVSGIVLSSFAVCFQILPRPRQIFTQLYMENITWPREDKKFVISN